MQYLPFVLAVLVGSVVVGVSVVYFLRARLRETIERAPEAAAAPVATELKAIGDQIANALSEQRLQGETQRQLLSQKLDGVRQSVDAQRSHVDGLRNELRHEVRRRDAEMDEIRTQIGTLRSAVALPPAAQAALPPALETAQPGPAELAPEPATPEPVTVEPATSEAPVAVSAEAFGLEPAPAGDPAPLAELEPVAEPAAQPAFDGRATPAERDPAAPEAADVDAHAAFEREAETSAQPVDVVGTEGPEAPAEPESSDEGPQDLDVPQPSEPAAVLPPDPVGPAPVDADLVDAVTFGDSTAPALPVDDAPPAGPFSSGIFEAWTPSSLAPSEDALPPADAEPPVDALFEDVAFDPLAFAAASSADDAAPADERAAPQPTDEPPTLAVPTADVPGTSAVEVAHGADADDDHALDAGAPAETTFAAPAFIDPAFAPSAPDVEPVAERPAAGELTEQDATDEDAPAAEVPSPSPAYDAALLDLDAFLSDMDMDPSLPGAAPSGDGPAPRPAPEVEPTWIARSGRTETPAPADEDAPAVASVDDFFAAAPARDAADLGGTSPLAAPATPEPPAATARAAEPFVAPEGADDLTVITSIDEGMQRLLYIEGVTTLEEIAQWNRTRARQISMRVQVSEETIMNQWVFEAQAAMFHQFANGGGL